MATLCWPTAGDEASVDVVSVPMLSVWLDGLVRRGCMSNWAMRGGP